MDINCKQGKWEWYESAFVVNVENNEFSLGPFNRWEDKNIKFKGKIAFCYEYQNRIKERFDISEETVLGSLRRTWKPTISSLCSFSAMWGSASYSAL